MTEKNKQIAVEKNNPNLSNKYEKQVPENSDINQLSNGHIVSDSIQNKETRSNVLDDITLNNEIWVFGYGSLVWKVDFPFECRKTGYIKGYLRRFYQNSIDHRGTKQKPGRVVTLIPSTNEDDQVWGMAYKIAENKKDQVIKHLDYREKNGYDRNTVSFYPYPINQNECSVINNIVIYVATKDNESFAGPTDLMVIANQITDAVGPSGTNREYVYKLADAMRTFFPGQSDEHLFEIERILKKFEDNQRE